MFAPTGGVTFQTEGALPSIPEPKQSMTTTTGQALGRLTNNENGAKPPARRFGAWLFPLAILIGFALIFALLFRGRLMPGKAVAVVPAIAVEEMSDAAAPVSATATGNLLFQASGWIEPDPLPIKATALTDGIVDEVHVLEGELVEKGDLLATLIGIDTRLERDAMAAELADMKASFDAHCAGTQIAMQRMELEKAHLAIAEADAEEAADKLRRYDRMREGAITQDERLAVRLDHSRALSQVEAENAKIAGIAEELTQIAYEIVALQAKIKGAEIALEKADLAHSRTRITAPTAGRVLALKAAPGQKKMVGMDDPDSATIAILYDPAHLQVRVDVPLADASGLSVGQRAKIRCNLLPDEVFEGEVTRIEGSADLQRNTLQAKVRIENPSEKLRPEMLSRVEFFETRTIANAVSETGSMAIAVYVPGSALTDGVVWVCDPDSMRAEKRQVDHSVSEAGLIRIDSGIRPGEWVIEDPTNIEAGQRLKPIIKERP
jgi:HlyD family secretion protein